MKLLTEATWVTKLKPPFGFISEGALFGQLFSLVRFHYFKHSAETDYNTSRLHLSSIINIILRKRGRLAKDVKDYDNTVLKFQYASRTLMQVDLRAWVPFYRATAGKAVLYLLTIRNIN